MTAGMATAPRGPDEDEQDRSERGRSERRGRQHGTSPTTMDSWPATRHARPDPVPDRTAQTVARHAEDGGGKEREPGAQRCQPQVRSAERICLPPPSLALLSVARASRPNDPDDPRPRGGAWPIREKMLSQLTAKHI